MPFPRLVALSVAASALLALTVSGPAAAEPPESAGSAATSPATYIVQFTRGTNARAEAAMAAASGLNVARPLSNALTGMIVDLTPTQAAALARNPRVAAIEQDGPVQAWESQSGPTWGLDRVDQRTLPLSGTYTYGPTGQGVTAYVIDSGIFANHADFGGRVVAGYSVISDQYGTSDCAGHGTHVAGTLAGSTWGVAKGATLVPVRVLNCNASGTWAGVISGIDWVIGHHGAGQPAVANISLGGGASSSVDAAIRNLVNDGITVAVAAGNANANACNYSPAREPVALTVGATTSSDARASYSNFGTCVDLFGPGSSITSAYYTSTTATALMSGTSMASPHVAGTAALILSTSPGLTPAQVGAEVFSDATAGIVGNPGTGSPNRMLFTDPVVAPTAPAAPTNVIATAGVESATVTWTQGGNGGSPLTSQTVYVYEGTSETASRTVSVSGSEASATITSLSPDTEYRFRISATNATDEGPLSDYSEPVTPTPPPTAPAAPTNVIATAGVQSATVTWTQGGNGGSPLTSQTVYVYEGTSETASRTVSVSGSEASATITSLSPDTEYRFRISATNATDEGPLSDYSEPVTPTPPPTGPVSTGWRTPGSNAPVTTGSGDNNGFQTNPGSAYTSDNAYAVDTNSGTSTSSSVTSTGKDRHLFSNFGLGVPAGATVLGIQVRLESRVDSTTGSPKMYIQLSTDGGATWTTAKATPTLSRSDRVYTLGGTTDLWGAAWTGAALSDANFRLRITNVATSTSRDFSLDQIVVDATYQ